MKATFWLSAFVLLIAVLAVGATSALAVSGYTLDWWTIDNGGGTGQSSGGEYTLSGTIGQWDAGDTEGGDYAVNGGFWNRLVAGIHDFLIYLPLIVK